jgi:3-phenylpropionate/cinnamic acid dioxygenase small subunit
MSETALAAWQSLREVELFLYREAQLADANKYDEWLALWADDLLYWVPCNGDDIDPQRTISMIYDDRPQLEDRIYRLGTKHAYAQRPKSRLTRLISNIVLEEDYDPLIGGTVSSHFIVMELRLNKQSLWGGRVRHILARAKDDLFIREKHVFLNNNDTPIGNMTFII